MSFTINTKTLQSMINKVIRGASNNKLLPITSYIDINFEDGTLSLTTTDMTNYITVKKNELNGDNFTVVISADKFSKLVAKTTTENITLELTDNSLVFKGNGTYNIDIPLNEEGNPIKYPMYNFTAIGNSTIIKSTSIKSILNYNKGCLSTDVAMGSLINYYCDNEYVITSDAANIAINSCSITDEPILISSQLMNLIGLFSDEDITFSKNGDKLLFSTPTMVVYGTIADGLSDYPNEPIISYLDTEFLSNCEVSKTAFLNVLDRMSLFVDDFNQCNLNFNFTSEGIKISNKANTAMEVVPYIGEVSMTEPYTCVINTMQLKAQITSLTSDVVEIHFAHPEDICIKFVEENVTKITALVDDE